MLFDLLIDFVLFNYRLDIMEDGNHDVHHTHVKEFNSKVEAFLLKKST
jgi:hypothetical protein